MFHLYPETDDHGAVFRLSPGDNLMEPTHVVDEQTFGMAGQSKETRTGYFVSPKINRGNKGDQPFFSLIVNLQAHNLDWWIPHLMAECLRVIAENPSSYLYDLPAKTSGTRLQGYTRYRDKSKSSVKVKDFRKRSAQGEIFNNPFASSDRDFTCPEVDGGSSSWAISYHSITNRLPRGQFWLEGMFDVSRTVTTFAAPPFILAELDQLVRKDVSYQNAVNTAFGNISQGEVELLVMAAEGSKTVAHLASTISRFAGLVKALKTGNFKELAPKTWRKWKKGDSSGKISSVSSVFADAWMEARYAWTPLVLDAIGSMNVLTGNTTNRSTFRGNDGAQPFDQQVTKVLETGLGPITLDCLVMGTQTARAGVLTEALWDSPTAKQLGVFNIATMVKEVIPYSFVLEWFINLSGLLYYLNPNPILRPRAAWATTAGYTHIVGTLTWTAPSGDTLATTFSYSSRWKVRTPVKGPSLLTVDTNLNLKRLVDAAILSMRWIR